MSGFTLVPVEGGEPIQLPPGEMVIGRGPLLRVGDKRVSRHHGLLENMNGCLRLKPTHVNPCFIQSSQTDDPQPLQRDSWFSLQDGDLFSLLPGQLIYRVVAVGDGRSSRNTQRVEEELPVSPKPNVEPLPAPACALTPSPQEPTEAPPPTQDQVSPLQTVNKEVEMRTEVTPRRRVLPTWMMTAVTAPPGSPSSSHKDQRATTTSKRRTAAKKPKTTSAEEEQEECGEDEKPKKRRNVHTDEQRRDVPAVPESTADISDESDGFGEETRGPNTNMAAGGPVVARLEDKKLKTKPESNNSSSSSPSCTARISCPYGKQCYRKNPVHFQEFSHPGDADYKEEEPEDAERPECPYGSDCYRKNPLHRKEYKHSEKPAYNTRPRRKEAAEEDGDEDFDDDDSFINDDSEDGGDDSDYAPPDSDDSRKEDIRRLQKEAQAFLKKRK